MLVKIVVEHFLIIILFHLPTMDRQSTHTSRVGPAGSLFEYNPFFKFFPQFLVLIFRDYLYDLLILV